MFKKYLSSLLSILIVICLLPSYAGAESDLSPPDKEGDTHVYKELIEKRTADSKTFVDNEGHFKTELYALPIHHKVNGKWKDISDRLVEKNDSEAVESEDTDLQAKFPKKLDQNHKMTYTYGGHH